MTLYISDLDGTLLNYNAKLKPRSMEMLNRLIKKGVLFSYATARGIATSYDIMKDVELNIPVITMNGVLIVDFRSKEILVKNTYTKECQKMTAEIIEKQGESPLVFSFVDGAERVSYLERDTKPNKKFLKSHTSDVRLRPCENYAQLFDGEMFFMTLINPKSDLLLLDGVFNYHNGFSRSCQRDTYNADELWYEVGDRKATKASAALQLKALTGADELVCFGDNMNDCSMFEVADRAYAVANACGELKNAATDIIGSNENNAVPVFIESEQCDVKAYSAHTRIYVEPDRERFAEAVEFAKNRETINIGTLNEKCIHSALKYYYADDFNHEAKIGSFYADIVNENGIIEIQTANFGKLNKKLDLMLDLCHVTVVYPFEKRVQNRYINENTGELLKSSAARVNKNLSKLCLELYRIKSFLTNPNLTLCIAEIEVEKLIYVKDEQCIGKGRSRKKQVYTKTPTALMREIYLEKGEDYRIFLPEGLSERFTVKDFSKALGYSDGKLLLEILEYVGVVRKVAKEKNAFVYEICR